MISYDQLSKQLITETSTINYMMSVGILQRPTICTKCNSPFLLNTVNPELYHCSNQYCSNKSLSLINAFCPRIFNHYADDTPLDKILKICYCWILDVEKRPISYITQVSMDNLDKVLVAVNMIIAHNYRFHYINPVSNVRNRIGGDNMKVFLVKTPIYNPSNIRTRFKKDLFYYIIGYELSTDVRYSHSFCHKINSTSCNMVDILQIITQYVHPGSIITTEIFQNTPFRLLRYIELEYDTTEMEKYNQIIDLNKSSDQKITLQNIEFHPQSSRITIKPIIVVTESKEQKPFKRPRTDIEDISTQEMNEVMKQYEKSNSSNEPPPPPPPALQEQQDEQQFKENNSSNEPPPPPPPPSPLQEQQDQQQYKEKSTVLEVEEYEKAQNDSEMLEEISQYKMTTGKIPSPPPALQSPQQSTHPDTAASEFGNREYSNKLEEAYTAYKNQSYKYTATKLDYNLEILPLIDHFFMHKWKEYCKTEVDYNIWSRFLTILQEENALLLPQPIHSKIINKATASLKTIFHLQIPEKQFN